MIVYMRNLLIGLAVLALLPGWAIAESEPFSQIGFDRETKAKSDLGVKISPDLKRRMKEVKHPRRRLAEERHSAGTVVTVEASSKRAKLAEKEPAPSRDKIAAIDVATIEENCESLAIYNNSNLVRQFEKPLKADTKLSIVSSGKLIAENKTQIAVSGKASEVEEMLSGLACSK